MKIVRRKFKLLSERCLMDAWEIFWTMFQALGTFHSEVLRIFPMNEFSERVWSISNHIFFEKSFRKLRKQPKSFKKLPKQTKSFQNCGKAFKMFFLKKNGLEASKKAVNNFELLYFFKNLSKCFEKLFKGQKGCQMNVKFLIFLNRINKRMCKLIEMWNV